MSKTVQQIREDYYQDMLKLLRQHGKVNLTCMPSFGKSWIFRRYIKGFRKEKVLYITDRKMPVDRMKEFFQSINKKCDAKTYQWCATRTESILTNFLTQFDTILFDESHAIGAVKAKRMIPICKKFNIKYVGATATEVRTDARNIVVEYFDGLELKYDMNDGIASGHLREPIFDTLVYLGLRCEKIKEELKRREGSEPLIELLTNKEKSVALKSTFDDSIKRAVNVVGKGLYILYHPTIHAMMQAKKFIDETFKRCFPDIQIFDITSHKDHDSIEDFEKIHYGKQSTGFSIIHSVNMLSTGYHPPDIKCLIFNALTSSRVKWTQQLGRIFKFGEDHQGYVIDLVGRFQEQTYAKVNVTPHEASPEEPNLPTSPGFIPTYDIETETKLMGLSEILDWCGDWLKGKYVMTPKMAVRSVRDYGNNIGVAATASGLTVLQIQEMIN